MEVDVFATTEDEGVMGRVPSLLELLPPPFAHRIGNARLDGSRTRPHAGTLTRRTAAGVGATPYSGLWLHPQRAGQQGRRGVREGAAGED